jgi:hypothetical protein
MQRFLDLKHRLDPDGLFETDLYRRLIVAEPGGSGSVWLPERLWLWSEGSKPTIYASGLRVDRRRTGDDTSRGCRPEHRCA